MFWTHSFLPTVGKSSVNPVGGFAAFQLGPDMNAVGSQLEMFNPSVKWTLDHLKCCFSLDQ